MKILSLKVGKSDNGNFTLITAKADEDLAFSRFLHGRCFSEIYVRWGGRYFSEMGAHYALRGAILSKDTYISKCVDIYYVALYETAYPRFMLNWCLFSIAKPNFEQEHLPQQKTSEVI
jgi:hypothetical protein